MGSLLRLLFRSPLLRPLRKAAMRFLIGALAIPVFRFVLRRVLRLHEIEPALERNLEQWFRTSLLLLVATANMEHLLFDWVPFDMREEHGWVAMALRLLMAVGVVEAMPGQHAFALRHSGPPPLRPRRGVRWFGLREQAGPYLREFAFQHLNRSSPVLAIMTAIFGGSAAGDGFTHWVVGWVCYAVAVAQYLAIGVFAAREEACDAAGSAALPLRPAQTELLPAFARPQAA